MQQGNVGIDLTNYFTIGQLFVPSFGISTEVILPWSSRDSNVLEVHASSMMAPFNPYVFASISVVGFIYE